MSIDRIDDNDTDITDITLNDANAQSVSTARNGTI